MKKLQLKEKGTMTVSPVTWGHGKGGWLGEAWFVRVYRWDGKGREEERGLDVMADWLGRRRTPCFCHICPGFSLYRGFWERLPS